jgi:hypothetical protein
LKQLLSLVVVRFRHARERYERPALQVEIFNPGLPSPQALAAVLQFQSVASSPICVLSGGGFESAFVVSAIFFTIVCYLSVTMAVLLKRRFGYRPEATRNVFTSGRIPHLVEHGKAPGCVRVPFFTGRPSPPQGKLDFGQNDSAGLRVNSFQKRILSWYGFYRQPDIAVVRMYKEDDER